MGSMKILNIFRNLKIKYKFFLMIALLMAIIIIITTIVNRVAYRAYEQLVYEQSAQALTISSLGMESELKKIAALSYSVATDTAIQAYLWDIHRERTDYVSYIVSTRIEERMVELGALDKYVHSIQLYDTFNKEYAVGSRPIMMSEDRVNRLRNQAYELKGGIAWAIPDEEDKVLTAVRNVRRFQDLSFESLGTLAVRIDVNRLFADYGNGYDIEDDHFVILRSDGAIIFPEQPFSQIEHLQDIYPGDQGYKIVKEQGGSYFISFKPSAYTDWTYITVMPYEKIFTTTENAKRIVYTSFMLLFVIAIIAAFHFSRKITDPLETLTYKMRKVQLGNFEYDDRVEMNLPMDEVGQIQRHFRIMLERINELIKENYVKQLAIKDSEFKALQAQINPHFLYNTLESINWTAKMNQQKEISQMVESLGVLLRFSINDKESFITIDKELEIVNHYITIQKYRFEERLQFSICVQPYLQEAIIPKLLIQPLVENAINYGLEPMVEPCEIKVVVFVEDNKLSLIIQDNGPGMTAELLESIRTGTNIPKGTGVGLANIKERLKLLYDEEALLSIESKLSQGTKIKISLPIRERDVDV